MNKFIYIGLMILGIAFICILGFTIYMKIMQRKFIKQIQNYDKQSKEIIEELLKHGK
jgi:hypothetical protein